MSVVVTKSGPRGHLRVGACLSLTGQYARFGTQAARGLEAWRALDGDADLVVEDDGSDPARAAAAIADVASRCDLLLGPYSTRLARAAAQALTGLDRLVWNHGGSGDDVEGALPGRMVSVLTPAGRYAEPFLRRLAAETPRVPLCIVEGRGSFGRQVAAGAAALAARIGLDATRTIPVPGDPRAWDLLCAGAFEEDVASVTGALALTSPPRHVCAVAAGVREFAAAVADPRGVLGIAQWFPGSGGAVELGPSEAAFLSAYRDLAGTVPDYPATQAAAAAVLATHCARLARDLAPDALWAAAASLDTTTLFGGFGIDATTGVQVKHRTVLVEWTTDGPSAG
jgi:Periplasmic binding protein